MSIQDSTPIRKEPMGYIERIGYGTGSILCLVGIGLMVWSAGRDSGRVAPFVIKDAFAGCGEVRSGIAAENTSGSPASGELGVGAESHQSWPFVASKRGTKYYPADCPSATSLSPKNKIGFATEDEAERAGYSRSAACPG